VSLVERAMIDAFCKAHHLTFSQAIQENVFGIRLDAIHPVLEGSQPRKFIPHKPLPSLVVRHTVGLADYLTDADIPSEAVLFDGLPQSLEANIRVYGLCYFKIKVSGDMDTDIPRLKRVATILDQECPAGYTVTLDGNEQFKDAAQFRTFWEQLQTQPDLVRLLSRMLWVEQPIHREFALAGSTRETILNWEKHPLMIIDESDSELESLPIALTCGYAGTSHKNCKGVFKGFANACLLAHYQDIKSEQVFILSGEDLANVGPVALLQDLVVMAVLGISHVERNGHHYFSGLSLFPLEWQNQVLAHHADLYQPAASGFPTLRIENGQIQTHSILHATFGYNTTLDFSSILQIDSWDYESLNTAPAKSTS